MSGTLCGLLDCYFYEISPANKAQGVFTILFNFFERMVAVGNAERIALQYGAGGAGTHFYDEGDPFGENAFFVYRILASASTERTVDLYVLCQWADTALFGTSPGDPGKLNGSTGDGVGLVAAFREDGGNPWNGTTNNDGTDTKGSTVWVAGGSTLHVLDRACSDASPNGNFVTNKENLPLIDDFPSYTYIGLTVIGDADSVLILLSNGNTPHGNPYTVYYFGIYQPRDGLTITHPYVAISINSYLPFNKTYVFGSQGGSSFYEGGVLHAYPTDKVQSCTVRQFEQALEATAQPNAQISPSEADQFPLFIRAEEDHAGICGQLPISIIGAVGNIPQHSTNATFTRAFLGHHTQSVIKVSIPWDGGSPPGTGPGRLGRTL